MYVYFYIDKNNELAECDDDTYHEWAFDLYNKHEVSHFYIKERNACVECPNNQLYNRLSDRYGNGNIVWTTKFATFEATLDKNLPVVHTVETRVSGIEYDDIDFYEKPYYPVFEASVSSEINGRVWLKVVGENRFGLDGAKKAHEGFVLDIISGNDVK
tara:strand:- start:1586 stop:2059 length:474 start_codon:yes stop_codon:yes gene_type:complete